MRTPTTTAAGPVARGCKVARSRPRTSPHSHKRWRDCRGPSRGIADTLTLGFADSAHNGADPNSTLYKLGRTAVIGVTLADTAAALETATTLDGAIQTSDSIGSDTAIGARPSAANSGPDFVAGPIGSEPPVPVSQSRMAAGFDEAGFPSTPTASPGVEYTLPDGTKVRLTEPSGQAPMRASFTNANGGPINPFTGKPVQPPAPAGWSMKDWVRALTHVEQTP